MTASAATIVSQIASHAATVNARRVELRAKIAEKLGEDFILSSFDYDNLIQADAQAEVWTTLQHVISWHREDGKEFTEEQILDQIRKEVKRYITINVNRSSSSSMQNQMYAGVHAEWVEAFKLVF